MQPDAPLRRTTTWLAIFGYTLVASGIPLPGGIAVAVPDAATAKRLAGKERSRPFPCMDKPCGCDSAARCFSSCCCHTPAQTRAWARAHGVEPVALDASVSTTTQPDSCCTLPPSRSAPARESPPSAAVDDSACPVAADASAADPSPVRAAPRRPRVVMLRAVLACGGLVAGWFVAGSAPPPPKLGFSIVLADAGTLIAGDAAGMGLRGAPEPPPPRLV